VLRYEDELRNAKSILSGVKEFSVDADELSLAKQLIKGKTSKLDLSAYKDDYEAAVKKTGRGEAERKAVAGPGARTKERQGGQHHGCAT
jgi:DNA end-binding protein Ku